VPGLGGLFKKKNWGKTKFLTWGGFFGNLKKTGPEKGGLFKRLAPLKINLKIKSGLGPPLGKRPPFFFTLRLPPIFLKLHKEFIFPPPFYQFPPPQPLFP